MTDQNLRRNTSRPIGRNLGPRTGDCRSTITLAERRDDERVDLLTVECSTKHRSATKSPKHCALTGAFGMVEWTDATYGAGTAEQPIGEGDES